MSVAATNNILGDKLYYKEYYRKNRAKIIEKNRAYYFQNREEWIAYAKEYNRKHPERRILAFKKWYKKNKNKVKEYNAKYFMVNKDKIYRRRKELKIKKLIMKGLV